MCSTFFSSNTSFLAPLRIKAKQIPHSQFLIPDGLGMLCQTLGWRVGYEVMLL